MSTRLLAASLTWFMLFLASCGKQGSGAARQPLPGPVAPVPCDTSKGSCYSPSVMADWQWQLTCDTPGTCADLSVKVVWYDLDWEQTPSETVEAIHAAGAHAACYINAGCWEDWRTGRRAFPPEVIGKDYTGWEGEKWLDIRRLDVVGPIMAARMDVCRDKGFDGVQFDNLDGWQSDAGFSLTQQDSIDYSIWLANTAHSKGLSAAWENAVENVAALLPYMDWFIMEECHRHNECHLGTPFIKAGKFVGVVEYDESYRNLAFCAMDNEMRISGMFKNLDLDSFRLPCTAPIPVSEGNF